MTIEVLVATMHQKDYNLLEKMNIQSDAIVINQCDKNSIECFKYKGYGIKWISTTDRGVGKSRNLAILNSSSDILLFADDDVRYDDGYTEVIKQEFIKTEKELIVFNLDSLNAERPEFIVKKAYKLKWFNSLKFGACRIAVKRESILKKNIWFSLLFGGGARYQAGEDNLFITNCLASKIKGYASNKRIGTVEQKESTWFKGFDEKYYFDRGCLFCAMYGKKAGLFLFLMELKKAGKGFWTRHFLGKKGIKEFKKNK